MLVDDWPLVHRDDGLIAILLSTPALLFMPPTEQVSTRRNAFDRWQIGWRN
jgi:hypothetical protein